MRLVCTERNDIKALLSPLLDWCQCLLNPAVSILPPPVQGVRHSGIKLRVTRGTLGIADVDPARLAIHATLQVVRSVGVRSRKLPLVAVHLAVGVDSGEGDLAAIHAVFIPHAVEGAVDHAVFRLAGCIS